MKTLVNELKNGALVLIFVILMSLVVVTAGAAVGTFTFRTSGASDTVEAVDLVYPQRVPEADSVTTESIADGSVTPAKISSGYNLLTTAEKTQALTGSSTVAFVAKTLYQYPGSLASVRTAYVSSASGSTIALETAIGALSNQGGRLTIVDLTNLYTASFMLRGNGSPASVIIDDVSSKFSLTDTAARHCIISDGDGTFSIKNNIGTVFYLITWEGRQ